MENKAKETIPQIQKSFYVSIGNKRLLMEHVKIFLVDGSLIHLAGLKSILSGNKHCYYR